MCAACAKGMNGKVNRAVAQRAKAGWLRRNSAVIPRPALAGLRGASSKIKDYRDRLRFLPSDPSLRQGIFLNIPALMFSPKVLLLAHDAHFGIHEMPR